MQYKRGKHYGVWSSTNVVHIRLIYKGPKRIYFQCWRLWLAQTMGWNYLMLWKCKTCQISNAHKINVNLTEAKKVFSFFFHFTSPLNTDSFLFQTLKIWVLISNIYIFLLNIFTNPSDIIILTEGSHKTEINSTMERTSSEFLSIT